VRLVADVVLVHQDRDQLLWQPVAAGQGVGRRVVDGEQPAAGVLLEPFPHVPLDGAGAPGKLRGGGRAAVGQRPVQAEPLAEVDGVQLQRPEGVLEQPLDQRAGRVGRNAAVPCVHGGDRTRGAYR
jgi:hypothetical protein